MTDENEELNDEQKKFVLDNWKSMDLLTMVRTLSGDPEADGRHKLGRAIKRFLASNGFEAATSRYKAAGPIILTEDQEKFIIENGDKMKTLELTRALFQNASLTPFSREFKAVYKKVAEINKNLVKIEDEPAEEDSWEAPKSVYKLIPKVNRHVPNPHKELEPLFPDAKKLTGMEEKCLRALLSYMNIPRFKYQMDRFLKQVDRELFESTFIGMTWDKHDLLREEVDQYISLASEIVLTAQIDRHIQQLDRIVDESLSGEGDRKLSMNLIELVNTARDKSDKSKERQRKLLDNLVDSRSSRLEKRVQANSSILNLVDAWRNEQRRQEFIKLAILQKQAESEEIDKIGSMSDVVALIAGITKDEIIEG